MVTTKLNLSMTEPSVRQIYAKQGDTGRVLDIALDQTPEDGTLRILRPDGVEVTSEAVTGGEVESGGTFESLTEADVTELTVGIEPVQDLNGYDKPWVGGAGKNKLQVTASSGTSRGITATVNSDGSVTINGTATGIYNCTLNNTLTLDGNYILSGCPSGGAAGTYRVDCYWDGQGALIDSGSGVAISPNGNTITTRITVFQGVTMNNVKFYPMIRLATETDPTWQPYSNICPITGNDEVRVTRTGKNLFDVSLGQYKALNPTTGELGADNPIRFTSALTDLPDGTYTFSFGSNMFIIGIAFYDKSGNFKRYDAKNFSVTAQTFSVEREKIRLYCGSAQNHDDLVNGLSVGQLELGSTATSYEPYQGSTYTTSLGQTVYGGTLDMVTGVLTVTHGNIASYNGETLPSTWISDRDVYASGTTPTTGAQVVYELATPLTYTLTAQQIKTLLGTNNVWASSGDIVNITFTYGGLLSELPSEATSIVGKCYCDIEQNGVSSMPFTLNVKKNERES